MIHHLDDLLLQVAAADVDSGSNSDLLFSFIGGDGLSNFDISTAGQIATSSTAMLDYESTKKAYTLVIQVEDQGATIAFSSTCLAVISLVDVNDNIPNFRGNNFSVGILEDQGVGTSVATIYAEDPDSTTYGTMTLTLEHTVISDPGFVFTLVQSSSLNTATAQINTALVLDRELDDE